MVAKLDFRLKGTEMKAVKDYIRTIVDFPYEGVLFRDVTALFSDPSGFRMAVDQMLHPYTGEQIDRVVGLEARGFILGGAIAHQLGTGFVPIRKKGKLPGDTIELSYDLEYETDTIAIQADAIKPGQKVVILDDLLATGGTAAATVELLRRVDADVISASFIIELTFLRGRDKLLVPASSLIAYND